MVGQPLHPAVGDLPAQDAGLEIFRLGKLAPGGGQLEPDGMAMHARHQRPPVLLSKTGVKPPQNIRIPSKGMSGMSMSASSSLVAGFEGCLACIDNEDDARAWQTLLGPTVVVAQVR